MMHLILAVALSTTIAGDWCAGSTNAFHEEFSLEKDGEFRSWIHQHPALWGSWTLKDRTLTIRGENSDTMVYRILRASSKRLVVKEQHEKRSEVYVRQGHCVAFEPPPKD